MLIAANKLKTFNCSRCGEYVHESHPQTEESGTYYCWDCGYIMGHTSEADYLDYSGISMNNAHATVVDGKIIRWIGNKAPWEYTDREMRGSKRYRDWRKAVLKRDNYTCTECGDKKSNLHAHHIKAFKTHIEERFEVSNGKTLCPSCHSKTHVEMRKGGPANGKTDEAGS